MGFSVLKSALLFAAAVSAERYIFSFGDSYTTTSFDFRGDDPSASNPIGNPTFPGITTSGGANYIGDFVSRQSGTLSYNFAHFSARVNSSIYPSPNVRRIPDFITQEQHFSDLLVPAPSFAPWTSDNSIFTAFFGINDISHSYPDESSYPDMLQSFETELQALYDAGARRFVLFTVPPYNRAPRYLEPPWQADAAQISRSISSWNDLLSSAASDFQSANAGADVQILDTEAVFNRVLGHPEDYGAPDNTCYNSDGVSCLWWNKYHPGQAIHEALGQELYKVADGMGFFSAR